jgi:glutathione reductase (NADPH)
MQQIRFFSTTTYLFLLMLLLSGRKISIRNYYHYHHRNYSIQSSFSFAQGFTAVSTSASVANTSVQASQHIRRETLNSPARFTIRRIDHHKSPLRLSSSSSSSTNSRSSTTLSLKNPIQTSIWNRFRTVPKWFRQQQQRQDFHPSSLSSRFTSTLASTTTPPDTMETSSATATTTDNRKYDYDFVVIGGGSGGVRASRISAGYQAKTLLIETQFQHGVHPFYSAIGGTCVNVGCVPKKLMVFASRYPNEIQSAMGYGWHDATVGSADTKFDWKTFMETKNAEITRLNKVYKDNVLASAGVEMVEGLGRLKDDHTIEIVHSVTKEVIQTVTSQHILISTGGWPFKPSDVPGAEEYSITSNEIFYLPEQPQHIVVVGGGFIAVEFACIMAGLGSKVTLMYRGDLFLRGFDDDMRNHLKEELIRNTEIDIQFGTTPTEIMKNTDGSLSVKTNTEQLVHCDCVLMATGRKGKVDGLNLESAGVEYDLNKGIIPVNEYSQTNVPHIYAVGDVTGRIALTPVALMEGHSLADTLFGGKNRPVDHKMVASTVFTTPEIGTVGYTETEAAQKFRDITVYKNRFRPMKHAFAKKDNYSLFKLIVDSKTDKVLGCHIATDNAGEMIQGVAIAMKMGATKADFDATIGIHPTSAEELVTMRTPSYHYVDGVKVEKGKA